MNIAEYERFVLGAQLMDRHAARLVAAELSDTSFHYGPDNTSSDSHFLIQRAIVGILLDGGAPDVATVAAKLGVSLDLVGGMAYLTRLAQTLPEAGIYSTAGLPEWAAVVDKASRLRQMSTVLGSRLDMIRDVEYAMARIDDVDTFLADTLESLSLANAIRLEYKPIKTAVIQAKDIIAQEADGIAVRWLPIGWPSLSEFRLLPYRSLFVLLGISSMGKSQLLAQFLLGSAIQLKRHNLPGVVMLNTYEMAGWQYVLRMAACISEVNLLSTQAQNRSSPEFARLQDALDFIGELPFYYDDGDMSSPQIFNQCALIAAKYNGIKVIGIDYSELVPDRGDGSEEQRIANIFRNAQRLSRTGPCTIMLSQFPKNALSRDDSMMGSVMDTRMSGSGGHAAEIGGIIYNPPQMRRAGYTFRVPSYLPDEHHAYLIIGKNKDGKTGWVKLKWTPEYTQFSDPRLSGFGMNMLYEGLKEMRQEIGAEGDF